MSIASTGLSNCERSLEPTRSVARRCGVSVRTVKRWVAAGILDAPIKVNGRDFFPHGILPKADNPHRQSHLAKRPTTAGSQEVTSKENPAAR